MRCGADDRQALEQLCRYITRPALANERVQCNAAGQVVLKLKTAWHDGTTHIVMSPLEFMQRLAARATEGRPSGAHAPAPVAPDPIGGAGRAGRRCRRVGARRSRAQLLKRVFEIDLEHCPNCGGKLKISAAIVEAPVIERILTHLGLQARAPARAPARGYMLHAA